MLPSDLLIFSLDLTCFFENIDYYFFHYSTLFLTLPFCRLTRMKE